MDQSIAQIVQAFAGVLKGLQLYPMQHPSIEKQLQTLHEGLVLLSRGRIEVRLGVLEGTLFVQEHLFAGSTPAADHLAKLLNERELEGLEFLPGISKAELRYLLKLLAAGQPRGDAFASALPHHGIRHIRATTVSSTEDSEEQRNPRKVYGRALKVVANIFHDIRLGRIPSSTDADKVVRSMVQVTLSDPHALFALSMLKDYDNYTFTHSVNVSVIALALGRACGLSPEQMRLLGLGGLLHDVGKLKVDHDIIIKPGRLTTKEFAQIKRHPTNGAKIVAAMEGIPGEVIDMVLGHHLRYDRTGYPAEALGRKLSSMAEMVAIADTYDAITTLRSYQRPVTPRKAIQRLHEVTGSLLHPEFCRRFIASLGNYPVGTLVRLDSNEIALVVRVGTHNPNSVTLKILFDPMGQKLATPPERELSDEQALQIVAEVDPFLKGVEVTDYFS